MINSLTPYVHKVIRVFIATNLNRSPECHPGVVLILPSWGADEMRDLPQKLVER